MYASNLTHFEPKRLPPPTTAMFHRYDSVLLRHVQQHTRNDDWVRFLLGAFRLDVIVHEQIVFPLNQVADSPWLVRLCEMGVSPHAVFDGLLPDRDDVVSLPRTAIAIVTDDLPSALVGRVAQTGRRKPTGFVYSPILNDEIRVNVCINLPKVSLSKLKKINGQLDFMRQAGVSGDTIDALGTVYDMLCTSCARVASTSSLGIHKCGNAEASVPGIIESNMGVFRSVYQTKPGISYFDYVIARLNRLNSDNSIGAFRSDIDAQHTLLMKDAVDLERIEIDRIRCWVESLLLNGRASSQGMTYFPLAVPEAASVETWTTLKSTACERPSLEQYVLSWCPNFDVGTQYLIGAMPVQDFNQVISENWIFLQLWWRFRNADALRHVVKHLLSKIANEISVNPDHMTRVSVIQEFASSLGGGGLSFAASKFFEASEGEQLFFAVLGATAGASIALRSWRNLRRDRYEVASRSLVESIVVEAQSRYRRCDFVRLPGQGR